VDPDSGGDTCDENEELNLGMLPQFSVDFSFEFTYLLRGNPFTKLRVNKITL